MEEKKKAIPFPEKGCQERFTAEEFESLLKELWARGMRPLDGQWALAADQLGTLLNATWYVESCVFPQVVAACDDTNNGEALWPVEMTLLGLLAIFMMVRKKNLGGGR
ncbi:MAG: hypothetical protein ACE5OZ_20415 [Candidatus Heimdallarchaeota archaeon]